MEPARIEPAFPGETFGVGGHRLHVVHSPEDRLHAVLQLIENAQLSVRIFSYMFGSDQTGQEVLAALTAAAQRGVKVQLIIDSFGSGDNKDSFFAPLVAAGGSYHSFSSRKLIPSSARKLRPAIQGKTRKLRNSIRKRFEF